MRICWKNNPVKFHPDLISNGEALGLFEEVAPRRRRRRTTTTTTVTDQKIV